MDSEKFITLRKGLLEFLILGIVSSGRVYVAEMMQRLSKTDFATQEGTLYPLLSKMRRDAAAGLRVAGIRDRPSTQVLQARGNRPQTVGGVSRVLEIPDEPHRRVGQTIMQTVIQVSLSGHSKTFQLEEDAYRRCRHISSAPDRASNAIRITKRFFAISSSPSARNSRSRCARRIASISRKEIDVVLDEVGAVNTGNGDAADTGRNLAVPAAFAESKKANGFLVFARDWRPTPALPSSGCGRSSSSCPYSPAAYRC